MYISQRRRYMRGVRAGKCQGHVTFNIKFEQVSLFIDTERVVTPFAWASFYFTGTIFLSGVTFTPKFSTIKGWGEGFFADVYYGISSYYYTVQLEWIAPRNYNCPNLHALVSYKK